MKTAIFFDMDGTLWDALIPVHDSWNLAMEKEGEPYRFDMKMIKSFMGLTPEETAPLAFPGTDFSCGLQLFKRCYQEELEYMASHPGILYPNEEEVISELAKKYPLYLVSNADKGYLDNYLYPLHMEKYFQGHLCAGDTGLAKWQNIQYLKEKEQVDQVIYVGDTLKDKVESERAGALFIHAAYGFGIIEPDPFKINNLKELPSVIESILKNQK